MAECKHSDEQTAVTELRAADDRQFICGICMENYTSPRYLPTCGHTFCEQCLFTCASQCQQQGSKLECPVCRKPHRFPENSDVTLDWIQTLPLNTVIIKMMESLPRPTDITKVGQQKCDLCKREGDTTVGVHFCLDCKETLCETCTKHHKKFKAFTCHKLIDVKDMLAKADRTDFFTSFTKCTNHEERDVEFYCKVHDVVVCAVCAAIDEHKTCNVTEISHHDLDEAKISEDSEELTTNIKAMIDHLNSLMKLKQETKTSLRCRLKKIREDVEEVRDQVIQLMERVVNHVTDVTKQIDLEYENSLDAGTNRLTKIKELIQQKHVLLDTIGQHGSERHKFISVHLLKEQSKDMSKKISEEDKRLKKLDAELKVADDIRKLIENTDVEKLVQVTVNESESSHKHLGVVSNYLRDSRLARVEEYKVCPNPPNDPWHYGIAIHKDGRVILSDCRSGSDHNGSLCLYNPENKTMLKLRLNKPYSAVQIDETHIAVSIPCDKTISIVAVGVGLRVEKTFQTPYTPRSIIALKSGQLAVAWSDPPAFGVSDISGTEIIQRSYLDQDKSGRMFKQFDYFAVDEMRHHVIQVCKPDRTIYCFDFTGEPVFTYTDPGLINPHGVALDKCGNIYVCQYKTPGRIFQLSPEGELISIMTEGVPPNLRAISSDIAGTGFWMTRYGDKVLYMRLEPNIES